MSEWIAVRDRLPDSTEYVFVATKDGEVVVGRYYFDEWYDSVGGFNPGVITHWMLITLPKSPIHKTGEQIRIGDPVYVWDNQIVRANAEHVRRPIGIAMRDIAGDELVMLGPNSPDIRPLT